MSVSDNNIKYIIQVTGVGAWDASKREIYMMIGPRIITVPIFTGQNGFQGPGIFQVLEKFQVLDISRGLEWLCPLEISRAWKNPGSIPWKFPGAKYFRFLKLGGFYLKAANNEPDRFLYAFLLYFSNITWTVTLMAL